jgi:hypothetical protein
MEHALEDFLDSDFNGAEEALEFAQGLVTEAGLAQLRVELRRFRALMAAAHEDAMAAPLDQREGSGVMVALRRWEPEGFKRLRRTVNDVPSKRGQRRVRFQVK